MVAPFRRKKGMLTVVAAIITSDGRVLACQRSRGGQFPLQWEFPGGKVREAETPQAALERELREELGVRAQIGAEIFRARHRYAEMDGEMALIFFLASADPSKIRNAIFERIEWIEPARLPELDFLAADRELVREIAEGKLALP